MFIFISLESFIYDINNSFFPTLVSWILERSRDWFIFQTIWFPWPAQQFFAIFEQLEIPFGYSEPRFARLINESITRAYDHDFCVVFTPHPPPDVLSRVGVSVRDTVFDGACRPRVHKDGRGGNLRSLNDVRHIGRGCGPSLSISLDKVYA